MADGNSMSGAGRASEKEEAAARAQGFKSAYDMYAAKIARRRSGKRRDDVGVGTTSAQSKEEKRQQMGKKKRAGGLWGHISSAIADAMGN